MTHIQWYRSIAAGLCVCVCGCTLCTVYLSECVNLCSVYVCVCLCNYQRVSVGSSSELFLQSLCLVPHLQLIHSATTLQHRKQLDLRGSDVIMKSFHEFVHKQTFSTNISLYRHFWSKYISTSKFPKNSFQLNLVLSGVDIKTYAFPLCKLTSMYSSSNLTFFSMACNTSIWNHRNCSGKRNNIPVM